MSRYGEVVDRLDQILNVERNLVELYRHSAGLDTDAEHHRAFHAMAERHRSHVDRIEHLKEALQREGGEGFFGELIDAIGKAFGGVLSSLPLMFIEGGTHP